MVIVIVASSVIVKRRGRQASWTHPHSRTLHRSYTHPLSTKPTRRPGEATKHPKHRPNRTVGKGPMDRSIDRSIARANIQKQSKTAAKTREHTSHRTGHTCRLDKSEIQPQRWKQIRLPFDTLTSRVYPPWVAVAVHMVAVSAPAKVVQAWRAPSKQGPESPSGRWPPSAPSPLPVRGGDGASACINVCADRGFPRCRRKGQRRERERERERQENEQIRVLLSVDFCKFSRTKQG